MRSPLLAAATTTFESLALLLPSSELTPAEAAAPAANAVRVAFAGPCCGALEVRVTADVARSLAENMLGVNDADPALVRDALGEVANVVCGNLLPDIGGREAVFHLSAPEPLDAATPSPTRCELVASLGVDGGRADLALLLDLATPLPVTT